jgi:lysylphosphatidylglycerol synthetase-like protein (DUF2156 family)
MWYLFAGKLMSLIAYFVFYKLLINLNDLNLLDRVFGWFFVEHVFEEYNKNAGKFFLTNGDFRNLIKNLLVIIRNILIWSHLLTLTEFLLTVSILILLVYFLFYFLKINKIKGKKVEVVIFVYYTLIIYILLLKTFVSFNLFDIYFIFKPILAISFVPVIMFFFYLTAMAYYRYIINNKNNLSVKIVLVKISFYIFIVFVIAVAFVNALLIVNFLSDNFLQEFLMKFLLIYTYIYYRI